MRCQFCRGTGLDEFSFDECPACYGLGFIEDKKMPKKSCTKNGKKGIKWGDTGACYTGPNKKAKMDKQRKAIEASKARRGK